MNYAKLENSPRLKRVLRVLKSRKGGLTTMEIIKKANVCAVNTCVDELRRNGYTIICKREGGAFKYRLVA